jgi:hypothetical protein
VRVKKAFVISILSIFAMVVNGQNYLDVFKLNYATTGQNKFDSSNASTSLNEMNGDLTIPFPVNNKFTILSGLSHEMTTASFNPDRKQETLTGLTLKLGANVKHSNKWSGTYLLLPKISSDLKNVGGQDFQFGAAVLLKYTKSDDLNYRFGVYANRELFGPLIVPIFGLYYLSSNDKFEVKILIPLSADFNYSITEHIRIGLDAKGQLRTYNLNTRIGDETSRYAARATNDIYSYFQYGLENGINFQVGVGRSIGRSYRIFTRKFQLPFRSPILAIIGNSSISISKIVGCSKLELSIG